VTQAEQSVFPIGMPGGHKYGMLTKRELFASLALHAELSRVTGRGPSVSAAQNAVKQADALIEALNREPSA
jgi:hypothetical protein